MSDSYAPTPARRTARGFHVVQARAGAGGFTDATHVTIADVTLWYGELGRHTLPIGTPVTVLQETAGLFRFTYLGCTAEHATANADLFAPIEAVREPA